MNRLLAPSLPITAALLHYACMAKHFSLRDFGSRISAWRRFLGVSQKDLAARAGLSVTAVSQIELGKMSPRVSTADSLIVGLGVGLAELLSETPRERFSAAGATEDPPPKDNGNGSHAN